MEFQYIPHGEENDRLGLDRKTPDDEKDKGKETKSKNLNGFKF